MKAAVLLAGCGVYDGSEIHESVFTLLALEENKVDYQCFAPDKEQFHVINHTNGKEINQKRNVLIESARISRGNIQPITDLKVSEYGLLVIPGGFGAAKNLNQWAIKGPEGDLDQDVKRVILDFVSHNKPICGLCMGPTVIAQSFAETEHKANVTVGTTQETSPYDIAGIKEGIESLGANTENKSIYEITIDKHLKIVTAPCYMMEASMLEVRNNIAQAIEATVALV